MDTPTGPDSKKARWSPTTALAANPSPSNSNNASPSPSAYANYGYGPNATAAQAQYTQKQQLYATPQLSINTHALANSAQQGGQISPNTLAAFQAQVQAQQQQQQQAASGQSPVVGQAQAGSLYAQFSPYGMWGGVIRTAVPLGEYVGSQSGWFVL
ncbi:hypothetical protein C8F04DRAFT_1268617 [Mycena alexandri]|uniref:Uncharacterized protein n=1 Tax=Mycena alexandri TaxID=1745969 RepID=A0AAD6SFV2_9AGAR|nr:hypothetical protein C8F04DRAFT_1268617 [Mycena alexandri]